MDISPTSFGEESPNSLPRNFLGISGKEASLDYAQFVVLPVPYEATTSYRKGTKYGPHAIIEASRQMEDYDEELEREPYRVGIHTLPALKPARQGPEAMVKRVETACRGLIAKNKKVITLGGEHTITLGPVMAYREKLPGLAVLHLDAHTDLRDSYEGTRYSHACVMRRVNEVCPILPVGVRSLSLGERDYLAGRGIRPFFYRGANSIDPQAVVKALADLGDKVYITIDLDVLDPSIMSAVGNPEPGGMGWHELLELLRAVCRRTEVVGFDVMELCPPEGPVACAYLAARLIYKLVGYLSTPG